MFPTDDPASGRRTGFYSWPRPYTKGNSVRIVDSIRDHAVFVGVERSNGEMHWCGTGFFVEIPLASNPDVCTRYFVTASHVADHLEGGKFFVRINKVGGGYHVLEYGPEMKWYRHPSKYTDVALCQCAPDPSIFDYGSIPIGQFLNDESSQDRKIGIGDEVVIVGLFTKHKGESRNIPILRLGSLAVFPDEKIPNVKTGQGKVGEMSAYLVEVRSTGGLSGSPVFVKESTFITWKDDKGRERILQGEGQIQLLGLAQGHWEIDPKDKNNVYISSASSESINLGIALIVPAYVIREVLDQDELVAQRRERDERYQRNDGTTTAD